MKSNLAKAIFFVTLIFLDFPVSAQVYPNHPIKVIVPFPPGETADILARLLGPRISEKLGQPVVVDNHAGASGVIGMDLIAKAPPDGYTIGVGQGGNLVTLPHTKLNLPYNALKDFTPITISGLNYLGIVTTPKAPFKSLPQMIAWAKEHPGELTVGTNGEGGFPHLTFEYLAKTAKFEFTHVPYKGASQIIPDLIGGQIMVGLGGVTSQTTQVTSGALKMLAITNATRTTINPDFPTVSETFPGWASNGWFGFVGPAHMDPMVVNKLNEAINYAMKDPAIQEHLTQAGLIPVTESSQFAADLIKKDYAKFGKLVADIHFQPQ